MRRLMSVIGVLALLVGLFPLAGVAAGAVPQHRCPSCSAVWTQEQMAAFDADVDGNGQVEIADLAIVVANMGRPFEASNIALYRSDCNRDRVVNDADFQIVSQALGLASPLAWQRTDANGDGKVDDRDLQIMRGWLGVDLIGNPMAPFCNVNYVDIPGQQRVGTMDLEIMLSFLRMPIPPELIPDLNALFEGMIPKVTPEKMPPSLFSTDE